MSNFKRKVVNISIPELQNKIGELTTEAEADGYAVTLRELSPQIESDLAQVWFTEEVYELVSADENLIDYRTFEASNGQFNGLLLYVGGEGECPILVMLYWDGTQIRAYIPQNGNPWNKGLGYVFGIEDEFDYIYLKKLFGNLMHDDVYKEQGPLPYLELLTSEEAALEDIKQNFKVSRTS